MPGHTLDLRFANDTERWVLVKGFVEWDGISVAIYGGERRRVESSEGTMTITGSDAGRAESRTPRFPGAALWSEEGGIVAEHAPP